MPKSVVSGLFLDLPDAKIVELVNTKDGLTWKLGHIRYPTDKHGTTP